LNFSKHMFMAASIKL